MWLRASLRGLISTAGAQAEVTCGQPPRRLSCPSRGSFLLRAQHRFPQRPACHARETEFQRLPFLQMPGHEAGHGVPGPNHPALRPRMLRHSALSQAKPSRGHTLPQDAIRARTGSQSWLRKLEGAGRAVFPRRHQSPQPGRVTLVG